MSKRRVNVGLSFDVSFEVDAKDDAEAEDIVEEMHLHDFLEWAGCATYDITIHSIKRVNDE